VEVVSRLKSAPTTNLAETTAGCEHPTGIVQPAIPFTSRDLLPVRARDAAPLIDAFTGLTTLQRLYEDAVASHPGVPFIDLALRTLSIGVEVGEDDLTRVPSAGPLIVAANHPHGIADGLAAAHVLLRVRTDVRILGNELLARLPELREHLITVNAFCAGVGTNLGALRAALDWLRQGHALIIFPAGAVSHVRTPDGRIVDAAWRDGVARLASAADAPVLPVFIDGANSGLFRLAGRIHTALRTALLPMEFLRHRGRAVSLRIGRPITARRLATLREASAQTAYVRALTYRLAPGQDTRRRSMLTPRSAGERQLIASEVPQEQIVREIEALPGSACLLRSGDWTVYCTDAASIPNVLREIGRLREITFRDAGEGTGRERDLDRFDSHYRHLFVWHREQRLIAGAYRVGPTDRILPARGTGGLYTRTLFRYSRRLIQQLGPALELGRSFVRPEFQRDYQPLLLLWRGIGQLVAREPRYRVLFGPVSISAEYGAVTRQILARFLLANRYSTKLGALVRPRRPLDHDPRDGSDALVRSTVASDLDEVNEIVRELESGLRGIPVLLRHYLKLNARLLGFSVDPTFGHVLDGLVVVDLMDVKPALLSRYLGKEEATQFLAWHSAQPASCADAPPPQRAAKRALGTPPEGAPLHPMCT
jgi:putative hemolysin